MKRVKHFTCTDKFGGKTVKVNLTMEVISIDGKEPHSVWPRSTFLDLVENWSGRAMLGLHQLGFSLAKIKMK